MSDTANPIYVGLLFILRCLVPLAILFGISYLLRRFGLVVIDSSEPEEDTSNDENSSPKNTKES